MNAAMITLSTDKMIDEIEAKAREELRQAQANVREELAKAREEEREEMMLAALWAGIDDQALRALYPKLTDEEFQRLLHKVKAGSNAPQNLE